MLNQNPIRNLEVIGYLFHFYIVYFLTTSFRALGWVSFCPEIVSTPAVGLPSALCHAKQTRLLGFVFLLVC